MTDISDPQMGELLAGWGDREHGASMSPQDKENWNIIRQKRHENNDLFMDWIEATHNCPRCGPLARRMHKQILWCDMDISHATKQVLNKSE